MMSSSHFGASNFEKLTPVFKKSQSFSKADVTFADRNRNRKKIIRLRKKSNRLYQKIVKSPNVKNVKFENPF